MIGVCHCCNMYGVKYSRTTYRVSWVLGACWAWARPGFYPWHCRGSPNLLNQATSQMLATSIHRLTGVPLPHQCVTGPHIDWHRQRLSQSSHQASGAWNKGGVTMIPCEYHPLTVEQIPHSAPVSLKQWGLNAAGKSKGVPDWSDKVLHLDHNGPHRRTRHSMLPL